ncbi:MAG: hypothetical protein J6U86_05535 [Clostridia bacterium]|nr:hypothetical protein [Clostridia bacterium]
MQIDKKALEGLLALNDRQLVSVINRLLSQSGISPSELNIDTTSVASIRSAISSASVEELQGIVNRYEQNQGGAKK